VTLLRLPTSLIKSPWPASFLDLIPSAQHDLLLVSPFVKVQATDRILSNLQHRGVDKTIRLVVLTNLRPESLLNGSTDIEALSTFGKSLPSFELVHLPSLHAKVYVADDRIGRDLGEPDSARYHRKPGVRSCVQ
jgi:phosphatidylserine/phosphatidylglycerophosphate/cardiolipin synthase-like enzyme